MLNVLKADAPNVRRGTGCVEAFSHLVISQRVLDQLGTGDQRGPLDVRLRSAGQRQDGHLAGDSEAARRRDRDSARDRSRGPIIRFFDPVNHEPIDGGGPAGGEPRSGGSQVRPPMGAVPAADGHGRRRADARCARAELQPVDRVLSRARAGDRQRRRAGHRRLRPAAGARRAIC